MYTITSSGSSCGALTLSCDWGGLARYEGDGAASSHRNPHAPPHVLLGPPTVALLRNASCSGPFLVFFLDSEVSMLTTVAWLVVNPTHGVAIGLFHEPRSVLELGDESVEFPLGLRDPVVPAQKNLMVVIIREPTEPKQGESMVPERELLHAFVSLACPENLMSK